ncbi:hypothetical protein VCRA2122O10_100051 [Vibrio crassostreae]|nr:hypothetical protein VCRA2122O10_100051 [Vibrio crassostreae]CAK3456807.1 hypothetical protein VCRA2120O9_360001 [Vibrio crassostreae]
MAVRIIGVKFGYTNYANYKNSAEKLSITLASIFQGFVYFCIAIGHLR